jgi:hypothetical protein
LFVEIERALEAARMKAGMQTPPLDPEPKAETENPDVDSETAQAAPTPLRKKSASFTAPALAPTGTKA